MKMNELFIINDYDTKQPFEYIITDNAVGCRETLEEFEKRRFEEDLEWTDYYDMLEQKGISFHIPQDIENYDY